MKIFIFLLSLFLLFSCWKSDNQWLQPWLTKFETNSFTIWVPERWSILKDSDRIPTPASWQVVLAAVSEDLMYWFANNILILEQDLTKNISSKEFSILNNVWATQKYLEYTKIKWDNFYFNSWAESNIYVFEAKYNTSTPKLKFIQTWVVCRNKWYLITLALSTNVRNTDLYEELLKTFSCKY